jgi:hypothetical protein
MQLCLPPWRVIAADADVVNATMIEHYDLMISNHK